MHLTHFIAARLFCILYLEFFFVVISTLFVVFVIGLPSSTNDPLLVHFPPKFFPRSVKNLSTFFGATIKDAQVDLVNLLSGKFQALLSRRAHLPCLKNLYSNEKRKVEKGEKVYVSCTLVMRDACELSKVSALVLAGWPV